MTEVNINFVKAEHRPRAASHNTKRLKQRPSDTTYSRHFPHKPSKIKLDPVYNTRKDKQRLEKDKLKGNTKKNSKIRNLSVNQTTSGSELGNNERLERKSLLNKNEVGLYAKLGNSNIKCTFGSLPILNKIQADDKLKKKVLLKHSYSWPSLQSKDTLLSLGAGEFKATCAVQTMGKTIDSLPHKQDNIQQNKCNKTEQHDINRNERFTKHQDRTPDKNKSRRKHSNEPPNERYPNNRPKPPSWQNFTTVVEERVSNNERSRFELGAMDRSDMRTRVRRGSLEATDKRLRSNIRRTHSMVIDASEMPEASNLVIPLAKSKPHEFRLRGTEFDDIMYMAENKQRCRDWLKTLEKAEFKHHPTLESDEPEPILSNNDTVTCDLELAEDRWDFLISPYPKGKRNQSL